MFIVPADTRLLSGPISVATYLCSFITENDQIQINEVEMLSFFNEAQQTLNMVYLLLLISLKSLFCLRGFKCFCLFYASGLSASSWELSPVSNEGEPPWIRAQGASTKSMYKALYEKIDEVLRYHSVLQAELEKAQKEASKVIWEHALLVKKVRVFDINSERLSTNANTVTSQA